jgi:branched-chain amino acid aminotransferase
MSVTTAPLAFEHRANPAPLPAEQRAQVLRAPGFGQHFTDHMARLTWTADDGWHDGRVEPYGPLQLDPSAAVLHYAQEIFEGLKAYRWDDGSVWSFRPDANAERFARSAARMALPHLPEQAFLESLRALVAADEGWVPTGGEDSLYLRPFMFASEPFLGVRAARTVDYLVIASPAGPYFPSGLRPVDIWLSREHTRSGPGGTGAAKCGGNYAASLVAQQQAAEHGCQQVVFLDATEQRWVEELGGMNVFFVHADGALVTPELSGTILEGVTRSSVLTLATELGLTPVERRVDVAEWQDGVRSGEITEVFACGTAAVVTPIGSLVDGEQTFPTPGPTTGPTTGPDSVAARIRTSLLDVQHGRAQDRHGWMHRLL